MLQSIKRNTVCTFMSWIWLGTVLGQETGLKQYLDGAVNDASTSGVEMFLCTDKEDTLLKLNLMKEVKKVVKVWKTPEINFRDDYLPVLHYLETSCLDNITLVLNQISNMKLLDKKHKWLIEGELEETELKALDGLRVDSNFVWLKTADGTIFELYKVHPSQPLILTQLHSPNYIKPTRNNLMGFPVPACFIKYGYRLKKNESFELLADKIIHPEGSSKLVALLPLLRHLLDSFNFTYEFIYPKTWGELLPNKTYSQTLGLLQNGTCELCLIIIQMRRDRFDAGEMIPQLVHSDMMVIFQEAKSFGAWNALMVPFSTQSWFFIFLVLAGFFFTFYYSLKVEERSENPSAIIEFLSAGLSQQGVEYHGSKTGSKLLILCLALFTYFIYTYYCCQVLNSLLSKNPSKINNLGQLLHTDMHFGLTDVPFMRVNLTKMSISLWIFIRANPLCLTSPIELTNKSANVSIIGPVDEVTRLLLKRVFENKKRYYTMEEAHPLIRAGKLALLANEGVLFNFLQNSFSESDICSTNALLKYKSQNTIFFAKGSYLKEMASQKILWMRETGLYKRSTTFDKMPTCVLKAEAISIGIKGCTIALMLLLTGIIITILILPLELYFKNKRHVHFK